MKQVSGIDVILAMAIVFSFILLFIGMITWAYVYFGFALLSFYIKSL